jgi:formate hydrogenlyase subunit 4
MLTIVLIFFTSLFFMGIIGRVKSIASGRKGPGILQPIQDILRLFRKGSVYSTASSFVFQIGATIYFGTVVSSIFLLPFGGQPCVVSFAGDFVLFAYLMALGRFFLIVSALDVASPFQGMGANREALYGMFVEPAFFVLFGSMALLTGHTSFASIFEQLHYAPFVTYLIGALAVYVLIQIGMIENSRLPVDDPKTHLELTMIHEVMVLDHSGFDFGLILYATALKFAIFGTLIANLLIPHSLGLPLSIGLYFVVQIAFAVLAGILESFRARNRMKRNPQFILTLTTISLLIFCAVLILTNKTF